MRVTRVSERLSDLGEGPHWDVNTQRLYYVDCYAGDICRLDPSTGKTESVHLDGRTSFAIPFELEPSNLLVSLSKQIRKLNFETGQSELLTELVDLVPTYSINDGKCDARGRLWTGTRTVVAGQEHRGHLFKMDKTYNLKQVADKITLSNGIAWSLNNDTMYYIDTGSKQIYAFDYNLETGSATNQRVFIDYNKHEEFKNLSIPDGMTIDIEGKLWVANHGAGCVVRINPETKSIMQRIDFPVKYPTSCCFGGPNFDILYVTTGYRGETDKEKYPDAGAVFAVTDLGTRGLPPNHFASELVYL